MKKSEVKMGMLVRLHTGKTTRSPVDGEYYKIVALPDKLFPDGVGIRRHPQGSDVYIVGLKRVSFHSEY